MKNLVASILFALTLTGCIALPRGEVDEMEAFGLFVGDGRVVLGWYHYRIEQKEVPNEYPDFQSIPLLP